jgi:uncharacterized protein (DUF2062 family)
LIDKKKWEKRIKHILTLDNHPGHIAAGFAVGVFISFTPFFGLHIILAIIAAFLLRLNKVTCITGACVNTPMTVPAVMVASYQLGNLVMGNPGGELRLKQELSFEYAMLLLDTRGMPLLIGASIMGAIASVAAYFLCYYLVVRFRRRDETLEERTREMLETGEETDE